MQAPLRTLRAIPNTEDERRRDPRNPGGVSATLITAGREPHTATLTDVSRHGCCAETAADWLRPGRFAAIVLPGSAPLECIVRWTRGGLAGLELLRPVPADHSAWRALID